MNDLASEAQRRRAINWALSLTTDTPHEPEHQERHLLEQYALGTLTLDQVLAQLAQQVHYILYCSEATHLFQAAQLTDLVIESQQWNEQHAITGLLCYSQGQFVQLIEGPAEAVQRLFANIRRDTRHHHVLCLRDGPGPKRWFPDWRMALVETDPAAFYWLLEQLDARPGHVAKARIPLTDPHLLTLLDTFRQLGQWRDGLPFPEASN